MPTLKAITDLSQLYGNIQTIPTEGSDAPLSQAGFFNSFSSQGGWGSDYNSAGNASFGSTNTATLDAILAKDGLVKELKGSGKMTFSKEGIVGTRIYEVPWVFPDGKTTWIDFAMLLMGGVQPDPGNTGFVPFGPTSTLKPYTNITFAAQLNQDTPFTFQPGQAKPTRYQPDVFSDEFPWLICQELDLLPLGEVWGYNGVEPKMQNVNPWPQRQPRPTPRAFFKRAQYQRVQVTAKYAAKEIDETVRLSGQALSRKGNSYAFLKAGDEQNPDGTVDPNKKLPGDLQLILPQADLGFRLNQVLSIDYQLVLAYIGCVNSDQFLGYPKYTLLFVGGEGKRSYLPSGVKTWDIGLNFLYNPRRHVKFFNPATQVYEYVKCVSTGNFPYPAQSFGQFFDKYI